MRSFLDHQLPDRMIQKARYEIAVAELRGRGSLDPAMPLVRQFLELIAPDRAPTELLNAAVLTVYAHGANAHGQSSIAPGELATMLSTIDSVLASALKLVSSRGDRCLLLEAQAMPATLPRATDSSPDDALNRFFGNWEAMLREVTITPLFPVTRIADIFEMTASIIEPSERLRSLIDQVDVLVAERAGKEAAADRARRRAIAHLKAKRHVAAIDELHRMKIGLFTGEHIGDSILSMLMLSQSYEALGLHIASRYYAAAALFSALHVENERIKRRVSQAAFRIADTFYAAGEGITYYHSLTVALTAHHAVAPEPHDWEKHSQVRRAFAHGAILRAVARRIAPEMIPYIDDAIARWPLPDTEKDAFISLSEGKPWSRMTREQIEQRIVDDLGQHPFGGSDR
jgi:hypothetical protein